MVPSLPSLPCESKVSVTKNQEIYFVRKEFIINNAPSTLLFD